MKNKVGGGTVVYHGAESFVPFSASKKDARSRFSLPRMYLNTHATSALCECIYV